MELTDITKEEERKMQKNEKQVIAVLAAAIAVGHKQRHNRQ